jgi:hypothetical protein
MLTYEKAIKSPKTFKAITGMTRPQFDLLYADVEKKYGETETYRLSKRPRERNIGAGHRFTLSLRDRLLMLLFYYRTYTTQIVCGMVFNVGQATVSRDIAYLEPAVRECTPIPEKMHAAANKARSVEDLEAMIPGLAVLVDVSEQQICRPQDDETQKRHYSGKAKRHTKKTQYVTTYDGVILQTSTAVEGSKHDFAIFKESVPTFPGNLPHGQGIAPDGQCARRLKYIADSAYVGLDKIVTQHDSRVSRKRKPGKNLTPAEKAYNRALAKIRIRVEHAIRRVKVFRVMGDRYRNPRKKYAIINDIVCGLVNMLQLWERAAA